MSETQTAAGTDEGSQPPMDVERLARANGWKSREELIAAGRDPARFVDAATFMQNGFENPAMLRSNNAALARRLEDLETRHTHTVRDLQTRLDQASETLVSMTGMMRTSEQRAYERARRELSEQMETAVQGADVDRWRRLNDELRDLEKTRPPETPPPPRVAPAPAAAPAGPQPTGGAASPPPEALRFFADNPWYNQDPDLRREADDIYIGLLAQQDKHGMNLGQILETVQQRMRSYHPDRTGASTRGNGGGAPAQGGQDPAAGVPRQAQASVSPSSEGPIRRPSANARTFATMPKEAKDAYARYKEMLAGKGDPLTEAEFARDYWAQFEE